MCRRWKAYRGVKGRSSSWHHRDVSINGAASLSFIVDHLYTWPLAHNLLGMQALSKLLPCDAAWASTQNHAAEVRDATGSNNADLISSEESYSNTGSCFRPGAYCFLT